MLEMKWTDQMLPNSLQSLKTLNGWWKVILVFENIKMLMKTEKMENIDGKWL